MMFNNERKGTEEKGEIRGKIQGTIETYQDVRKTIADTILMITRKFGLSESASHKLVNQYWKA